MSAFETVSIDMLFYAQLNRNGLRGLRMDEKEMTMAFSKQKQKEIILVFQRRICSPTFIAAVFTTVKTQGKKPEWKIDERIQKM